MFVGRIGAYSTNQLPFLRQSVNRLKNQPNNTERKNNRDAISFRNTYDTPNIGIYQRSNRLSHLTPEKITYADKTEMPDLKKELIPPSERGYTKEDALLNQYGKQFRLDVHLIKDETGQYVAGEGEGGRLFAPDLVSADELETFRQSLIKNGLGNEIDWEGVKSDLYLNSIDFGNAQKLEMKTDYLASRYAVLKNRIETEYAGDEKEEQISILNDIYKNAKDILADSFAESIGGFFEDMGQQGVAEDMRDSLLTAIDQRADDYGNHILEKGNSYSEIMDQDEQWLYQDDGFMAAQLREAMPRKEGEQSSGDSTFSFGDLKFAGIYAKTLNEELTYWNGRTYNDTDDNALGRKLAEEYQELKIGLAQSDITDSMKNLFHESYKGYMDALMDELDQHIDGNRQSDLYGLRRNYIDREAVYGAFRNIAGQL